MAANDAAFDNAWLRELMTELGQPPRAPTVLNVDNQTAILVATDDNNRVRRKHINVKHFFLRQEIAAGRLQLRWCPTAEQLADILTKALPQPRFELLRNLIMGCSSQHSSSSSSAARRD